MPKFNILKQTNHGRLGRIHTSHGTFDTPGFFFCATSAALRGITTTTAKEMGTQGILCNTYHLMDEAQTIRELGGLHKFLNWDGPIITDSGGFQIFSLGHGSVADELKRVQKKTSFVKKISDDQVTFKHIRNGSLQTLSPFKAIQIQKNLGTDLMFVLDECTPHHVSKQYTYQSLQLTKRWSELSLAAFNQIDSENAALLANEGVDPDCSQACYKSACGAYKPLATPEQGLYGIVQGATYPEFRLESIEHLNSLNFFGYGIGGSLGSKREDMIEVLDICKSAVLPERPVHLLGIGKVQDIIRAIPYNIDTFDCVHPTRIARHAGALVPRHMWEEKNGKLREHIVLTNSQYGNDSSPIDPDCGCYTCSNYSKAYIHHLFAKREMLGIMLIVAHNVYFMNKLLADARHALATDTYPDFVRSWE